MDKMLITVIIVNYNVYEDIKECIASIQQNTKDLVFEFIVVDNNSSDRDIDNIINDFPDVEYVKLDVNNGFGYANNVGLRKAKGEFILLMNPDILVEDDSISLLVQFLRSNEKTGVVGPVLYKPGEGKERYYPFFPSLYSRLMQENWMFQTAPITKQRFTTFWDKNVDKGIPFKVDWVMGAAMLIRKEIVDSIGGFDEAFFLYEEETEWEYRMSLKGWDRYIVPQAKMIHNHHSSTSKIGQLFREYHEFRSRIVFWAKHDRGIKGVIRAVMIYTGLKLRPIWFSIKYAITRDSAYKTKKLIINNLLKFFKSGREAIINNRFDFNNDINIFKV